MGKHLVTSELAVALPAFFEGGAGPSHYELDEVFTAAGLHDLDPKRSSTEQIGKEKRLRGVLSAVARDDSRCDTRELLEELLGRMRARGLFDMRDERFAGTDKALRLSSALRPSGFDLDASGHLCPLVVSDLAGPELRDALESQIQRIRRAADDTEQLLGTAKDLVEGTARYVLERAALPSRKNASFDELVHLACDRLELLPQQLNGESAPAKATQVAMSGHLKLVDAIRRFRNAEGTGHGRATGAVTNNATAQSVAQSAAVFAQLLLSTSDSIYGKQRLGLTPNKSLV